MASPWIYWYWFPQGKYSIGVQAWITHTHMHIWVSIYVMVSVQMCACAYVEARGGGHTLPSYFKTWSLCAAEASVFLAGLAASKPHWSSGFYSLSVEEEACTGPHPPCYLVAGTWNQRQRILTAVHLSSPKSAFCSWLHMNRELARGSSGSTHCATRPDDLTSVLWSCMLGGQNRLLINPLTTILLQKE